jgi:hypothetical protein
VLQKRFCANLTTRQLLRYHYFTPMVSRIALDGDCNYSRVRIDELSFGNVAAE